MMVYQYVHIQMIIKVFILRKHLLFFSKELASLSMHLIPRFSLHYIGQILYMENST